MGALQPHAELQAHTHHRGTGVSPDGHPHSIHPTPPQQQEATTRGPTHPHDAPAKPRRNAEFYRLQIDLSIEYENEGVPESESVLAEHREDEIATAVADQTCRKDVGYEDELIQIQYRLESDVATRYEDSIAELTTLMETTPDTP